MKLLSCLPEGCPKLSPWGVVQHGEKLSDGVYAVSTASHGGIKCYPKANVRIPAIFRANDGWYEEDCDWAIPVIFLGNGPGTLEDAHKTLKNWHWKDYEQHFGVVLAPGESRGKDRVCWTVSNAGRWIVTAAWGDYHSSVPQGMVGCHAVRDEDQANSRYYLVPREEYAARNVFGFVIDESKHGIWEGP